MLRGGTSLLLKTLFTIIIVIILFIFLTNLISAIIRFGNLDYEYKKAVSGIADVINSNNDISFYYTLSFDRSQYDIVFFKDVIAVFKCSQSSIDKDNAIFLTGRNNEIARRLYLGCNVIYSKKLNDNINYNIYIIGGNYINYSQIYIGNNLLYLKFNSTETEINITSSSLATYKEALEKMNEGNFSGNWFGLSDIFQCNNNYVEIPIAYNETITMDDKSGNKKQIIYYVVKYINIEQSKCITGGKIQIIASKEGNKIDVSILLPGATEKNSQSNNANNFPSTPSTPV